MKSRILWMTAIIALGTLLFSKGLAQAELITIMISGEVTYVDDLGGLDNEVDIGDTISGTYTYDSTTLGVYNSGIGLVEFSHYSAPAGISVNIGEFNFSTDPGNIEFDIFLKNNTPGGNDVYGLESRSNLALSNGAPVDSIFWSLVDDTSTALNSDSLPLTEPELTNWSSNNFEISGIDRTSQDFYIVGQITSATLIPEPCTLGLFGFGVLILRKKTIRAFHK